MTLPRPYIIVFSARAQVVDTAGTPQGVYALHEHTERAELASFASIDKQLGPLQLTRGDILYQAEDGVLTLDFHFRALRQPTANQLSHLQALVREAMSHHPSPLDPTRHLVLAPEFFDDDSWISCELFVRREGLAVVTDVLADSFCVKAGEQYLNISFTSAEAGAVRPLVTPESARELLDLLRAERTTRGGGLQTLRSARCQEVLDQGMAEDHVQLLREHYSLEAPDEHQTVGTLFLEVLVFEELGFVLDVDPNDLVNEMRLRHRAVVMHTPRHHAPSAIQKTS